MNLRGVLMDTTQIQAYIRQYAGLRDQLKEAAERQSQIKALLEEEIDARGEVDGRGHITLEVAEPTVGIASISKQKRVTQSLDIDVAESLLKEKELYDSCITMVPQINEDAIMASYYEGKLTEEDIDKMFNKKVSYAFLLNKG
jgi:hypothetical protein